MSDITNKSKKLAQPHHTQISQEKESAHPTVDNQDIKPECLYDWWGLSLFWALLSMVVLQFVSRYLFNSSIAWTEELARYLLVATTYFGSVSLFRRNNHIAIEAVRDKLPILCRRVLETTMDFVTMAFLFAIAWYAFGAAQRVPGTMASLPMPKNIVHYAVMVAFILMGVMAANVMIKRLLGRLSEREAVSI
ncbi:TRAP transporter small permease [Halomonas colorata]|uniref:TRAP transporter small permease n=1 Tax=Halomonas colorata TaxID=2742615 RepID=UPI0018690F77|nr:TRAP transporter small permease [Halomonas colorata]